MDKLVYTAKEAAEVLGMNTRSLYKLLRRGEIPYRLTKPSKGEGKRGGKILIPVAGLNNWLEQKEEVK